MLLTYLAISVPLFLLSTYLQPLSSFTHLCLPYFITIFYKQSPNPGAQTLPWFLHLWRHGWTMARNAWLPREDLSCSLTERGCIHRPIIFLLHLKHHHFLCPPILHRWVLFTPVTRLSQTHWYLGTRDCGLSACNMLIQDICDSWNCQTAFLNKTISWCFSAVPLGKVSSEQPFRGDDRWLSLHIANTVLFYTMHF